MSFPTRSAYVPEILITAIPARPGAEESAKIVSGAESVILRLSLGHSETVVHHVTPR
jgi:hypothetical protein